MDKIQRLFFIMHYLSNHDLVTAKQLANLCNTSVRTIYRDIQQLEGNGFLIIREENKGYRLIEKPVSNAKLTSDELIAISLIPFLPHKSNSNNTQLLQFFKSAIAKIGVQSIDRNINSFFNQLGKRILYQDHTISQQNTEHMTQIIQSITKNHSIKIKYYSIYRDAMTERIVDPYYLVPRSGNLYLIGFCHMRRDIRIFRVNRIRDITITKQSFNINSDFNINDFLKNRWAILAEDNNATTFKVLFSNEVARYIEEMNHYVDATLENLEDNRLLLTVTVQSKTEFIRWIRQFGKNAEILEPHSVRKKLYIESKEIAEMYQESPSITL